VVIKARVAGELQGFTLREGDIVKAGQVIARVEPTDAQARLRQSQQQAESAKAQVEIAQRTLSAICHAIGKLSVQDSEELHMQPMTAVVAVKAPSTGRDGKTYAASNEIKTYKVLRDAPAPVSSGSAFRPAQAGSGQMASAPWKRSA